MRKSGVEAVEITVSTLIFYAAGKIVWCTIYIFCSSKGLAEGLIV